MVILVAVAIVVVAGVLLAMDVVREGAALFVVTEGGFAKRTNVEEYRVQGRGGLGIKVANLVEARGDLVGALVTDEDDEVLVIMERGKIVRSAVKEVHLTGRTTQGVTFAKPDKNDRIIAVARNVERNLGDDIDAEDAGEVETDAVDTSVDGEHQELTDVTEPATETPEESEENA